jgi:NAD dependent epimerase/dehydratase family enzyme
VNEDFASQLCIAWEETAQRRGFGDPRGAGTHRAGAGQPKAAFCRGCCCRSNWGWAGRLGNGRQWMPWIHIDDQIALIDFLLQRNEASGPYNACAPKPVRNREFAKTLGSVLHRPAFCRCRPLC